MPLPAHAITRGLQRIAGVDRYQTSVDLSIAAFPEGAEHAIVASGAAFPDGLAAGPLAALVQGPVLAANAGFKGEDGSYLKTRCEQRR